MTFEILKYLKRFLLKLNMCEPYLYKLCLICISINKKGVDYSVENKENIPQEEKKSKKKGKWKTAILVSILLVIVFAIGLLAGGLFSLKNEPKPDNETSENIVNKDNENANTNTKSNDDSSITDNNEQKNQDKEKNQGENEVTKNEDNTSNNVESSIPKGITIYSGKEVDENVSYTFGYSYETLLNEDHIKNGKDQVNRVLSKYPKGFWDELLQDKDDSRKSLIICLTGKLKDDASGEEPTGFATYNGDAYYIFMNSAYAGPNGANIEGCLFHELMHVIDFYLQAKGEQYTDWEKYLPEGFAYTGIGANHSESEFAMCSSHATNNDDVWFEAIYSVESAMEDRANIMKELYDNGLSYYKKYPHYYARMKYLKDILYRHFESIRNCGYDWLG